MNRLVKLNVLLTPDNLKKDVLVNPTHPIGLLRIKISQAFNIPIKNFQVKIKANKIIESDDDETLFNDYGFSKNIIATRIINQDSKDLHPKNIIQENPQYFELLFNLLNMDGQSSDSLQNIWELILKLPINKSI
jgi:hypothetical protein